jgi:hypothetical protein
MSTKADSSAEKSLAPVEGPELAPSTSTDHTDGDGKVDHTASHLIGGTSIHDVGEEEGEIARTEDPDLCCLALHEPRPIALLPDLVPPFVKQVFGAAAGSPYFLVPAFGACAAAGGSIHVSTAPGAADPLALRAVFVTADRSLPEEVTAVAEAAYAVEAQEAMAWARLWQANELQRRAFDLRRRLLATTLGTAEVLGLRSIERPDEVARPVLPLRPQFVLAEVRPTTMIKGVAAANKGLLVVASGKMPTFAGVGTNYDTATADLLNKAAEGSKIAVRDATGCVQMRHLTICAIGAMTQADALDLYKASPAAVAATIFMPPPGDGDKLVGHTAIEGLGIVLGRLRAIGGGADALRLTLSPEAQNALDAGRQQFAQSVAMQGPPLSYFYAGLGTLAVRLAAVLHLIKHAVEVPPKFAKVIQFEEMDCAVRFVKNYVMPAGYSVLSDASVDPVVRHGRRIMSFTQQYASPQNPGVSRRDLVRSSQRVATATEIDAALDRLAEDGLIQYREGARTFDAHPTVFLTAYRLPDLVTDPRRK